MDTREYVVPIHDLDSAGKQFSFELPMSWLLRALEGCEMQPTGSNGLARVELSKTGTDVLVRGTIDVELTVPCARCLTNVTFRPPVELSLVLEPAVAAVPALPPNVKRFPAPGTRRSSTAASHENPKGNDASSRRSPAASAKGGGAAKGHAKAREEGEETDASDGDADRDTYEGEEVVLDGFFREALLLESPIFPLCSETCEGIRPGQASAAFPQQSGGSEPRVAIRTQPTDRRNSKE